MPAATRATARSNATALSPASSWGERLAGIPTTQLRIVLSLALVTVTILVLVVGMVVYPAFARAPLVVSEPVLWFLGGMLTAMMAADVGQYAAKRFSYTPAPPASPDIEDAKAGVSLPDEGRGGNPLFHTASVRPQDDAQATADAQATILRLAKALAANQMAREREAPRGAVPTSTASADAGDTPSPSPASADAVPRHALVLPPDERDPNADMPGRL